MPTARDEVNKQAIELVATINSSIWAAAADAIKQQNSSGEAAKERLVHALRYRLTKSHPSLLKIYILKAPSLKRRREAATVVDLQPSQRSWRPSRPAFAIEIARLLEEGVGLIEVPEEKRDRCDRKTSG